MKLQIRRINCVRRIAPVHLDDPFRVPRMQAQVIAAVHAVDTDTATLGDVTDDALRRHRSAAARKIAQQVANTTDRDIAGGTFLLPVLAPLANDVGRFLGTQELGAFAGDLVVVLGWASELEGR